MRVFSVALITRPAVITERDSSMFVKFLQANHNCAEAKAGNTVEELDRCSGLGSGYKNGSLQIISDVIPNLCRSGWHFYPVISSALLRFLVDRMAQKLLNRFS